jgi:hypothetical protein
MLSVLKFSITKHNILFDCLTITFVRRARKITVIFVSISIGMHLSENICACILQKIFQGQNNILLLSEKFLELFNDLVYQSV